MPLNLSWANQTSKASFIDHSISGLYIIEFPPPWGGGKIKGSGDGEENQRGKKKKKRKFGENITFDSTKS